jgi:transposase
MKMAWRSGQAYAQDLRARVLAATGSARLVAARFEVSVSYVVKARQRQRDHGEVSARPQRSHTPRLLASLHDAILAHVAAHADATLAELREWLQREHRVSASMGLMWNTLHRLGLTLKKRPSAPPSRRVPMSPKRAAYGPNGSPASTQRG